MNVLLFSAQDKLDKHTISVSDERLTHLHRVHGAVPGDTLRVGEINGLMGTGTLISINQASAQLQIELNEEPPAKLPLTLVLALPRPKMLRRILRTVAELGVPHLHLINSYRVEKSYWQTPVLEDAAIERYLLQGLTQARDTQLPRVTCHARFKPFVEDILPTMIGDKQAIVFHPDENAPGLHGARIDQGAHTFPEVLLVLGPEGGFIPYEVEGLTAAGCAPTSLGPRILRVENAVNVVLGHFLLQYPHMA